MNHDLGLTIGFLIILIISISIFFIFQIKIQRLYVNQELIMMKGFFLNKKSFDPKEVSFLIKKKRVLSLGLVELFNTIKGSVNSHKIITIHSGIKQLTKLGYSVSEEK